MCRHWLHDQLQTQVGFTRLSVNLDFHGVGQDRLLDKHPLRYNLEPTGGVVRAKYRFDRSPAWAGLGYAFGIDARHLRRAAGDARAARLQKGVNSSGTDTLLHV